MKVALLIPTLNAGPKWIELLESIEKQTVSVDRRVIIDSGSKDGTLELAKEHGFDILRIKKENFDHGYARQLLAEEVKSCEILLYLTQDCVLEGDNSISNLLSAFEDPKVGIAYGRQLPRQGAKILETHARLFNYPPKSIVKALKDKDDLGIKTASCSNSYAAYRFAALKQVGGFPEHTIFAEDVIVGGRMLIEGWKIYYVANALAYHSHDYTLTEEFKRYFDIGVYHSTNKWLLDEFGKADGEGFKYLKSELRYVVRNDISALPKMFASIWAKFLGYKLGMKHQLLSQSQRKSFSMHRNYWDSVVTK